MHLLAPGNKRILQSYYLLPHNPIPLTIPISVADSASPETCIAFCLYAIKNFPAQEYILIISDHGSGILDVGPSRVINRSLLYMFNPETQLLELNRTIPYLDLLESLEPNLRGICYDDLSGNYFTYQKLEYVLKTICTQGLEGKKFKLIGFDACLMAMLEEAYLLHNYAEIMVASQELEPGPGWKYDRVLAPFTKSPLKAYPFALHIVDLYRKTYAPLTHDYTLSAIDLQKITPLQEQLDELAQVLIAGLNQQKNSSVIRALKASRNRAGCTHFQEPSYIDLHHFLRNLLQRANSCSTTLDQYPQLLKSTLAKTIRAVEQAVIANTVGEKLKEARGLSIYFPETGMHPSYPRTQFAQQNAWGNFLVHYILSL